MQIIGAVILAIILTVVFFISTTGAAAAEATSMILGIFAYIAVTALFAVGAYIVASFQN